ncbi:Protein of unknown function [Tardiphaga sp. OK246]|jgi:hypothetical protein|nr:Protein of unknown function [Tardiphaga sp. OK246]
MAFLEYRPTQTLYQFCSVDGFRGILASKEIWCTDLNKGNDPRELKLGFQHFMTAFEFVRSSEFKGSVGDFLDKIKADVERYQNTQRAFCACFSLIKDGLPMWNEYGSNYSGLAIGFRPSAITSMPGRIQKVKYMSDSTPDDFRQLVREIAGDFDRAHSPDDLFYWIDAVTSVMAAIIALKHRSWAHEQEIRFVHMQTSEQASPEIPRAAFSDGTEIYWKAPLKRDGQRGSVEYKTFPFGRRAKSTCDPSRAIERVIIGPRCPLTRIEIQADLEANGFTNFVIEASDCQIR